MQTSKKTPSPKERIIQNRLYRAFFNCRDGADNNMFFDITPNIYLFFQGKFESDLLMRDQSNYLTEFEIKCSRWDLDNEFQNKRSKHVAMYKRDIKSDIPNKFYFVLPRGIMTKEEKNKYSHTGLIEYTISQQGEKNYVEFFLQYHAPLLHSRQASLMRQNKILRSGNFEMWRERTKKSSCTKWENRKEHIEGFVPTYSN